MPHKPKHGEPTLLTGLSLLVPITLSTMAIVLLAPILPKLMAEYASLPDYEYWVPMVITVPALCVALLSPVAGVLGDCFGRRKLLLWSFVLYAVVGVAPIFLSNIWAILASRIGLGVAEALIMVLSTTMIGDYFKGTSRDRWLAAQTATASLCLGVLQSGRTTGFAKLACALLDLSLVHRHVRAGAALYLGAERAGSSERG